MLKELLNKEEIIRMIKYTISAGTSILLDLFLFTVFHYCMMKGIKEETIVIILSTILARIISSLYNYFINSRLVFKNKNKNTIIKYYILVVIQMIASGILVSIAKKIIPGNITVIKFFVDVGIFIVNYFVQKKIIFKERT